MAVTSEGARCKGLPPLVGLRIAVVSHGLERSYDRARGLEEIGYRVLACGDATTCVDAIVHGHPDAVVVDLGRDVGFPAELASKIRDVTNVPLLVVGCAGTQAEMIRAFESGADDYCRPRCPTEEIDVRLRVIFRRMQASGNDVESQSPGVLCVGDIEVDTASQSVRKRGQPVPLSPTEFRLLLTLAEHAGEVIPSKALIARVWGNQYAGEAHYLRLYIRYLRQKLEDDPSNPLYIVNRWGTGYALESPARAVA